MYMTYEAYYCGNTCNVDYATWRRDYFVLAYDLRCYQGKKPIIFPLTFLLKIVIFLGPSDPNSLPLLRSGELKLHLRFRAPLEESLMVLCYSWSPALLTLRADGSTMVSYRY